MDWTAFIAMYTSAAVMVGGMVWWLLRHPPRRGKPGPEHVDQHLTCVHHRNCVTKEKW